MSRWTIEGLKGVDSIDFAIRILGERQEKLSNPYSPLNEKINEAKIDLINMKNKQLKD